MEWLTPPVIDAIIAIVAAVLGYLRGQRVTERRIHEDRSNNYASPRLVKRDLEG